MSIVYLTTESYHQEPILKSQVEPLLVCLSKDNYKFTLVTFERSVVFSDNTFYNHIQLKFRGHFFNIFSLVFHSFKLIKKNDIIHVRSYPPMIAALFVGLFKGNKVIFDPRGLWPEEMSYAVNRPIITFVFKHLEKLFCKFSSRIILVSKAFEDLFIERYPFYERKFCVIPTFSLPLNSCNAPSDICFKKDIFNKQDSILFVYSGSFESWQKIEIVVEYFQFLEKRLESSRFLFLTKAKNEFDNYLRNNLPVDKYFVYSANQNSITSYLSQCDYGIIIRDKHLINQVSAPIKIKDYLTSNLRVLLSDNIGDSSEMVRANELGFIFNDYSIRSYEESLKYINSINYSIDYFTKAEVIDKFSLKYSAKLYKEIYNEL